MILKSQTAHFGGVRKQSNRRANKHPIALDRQKDIWMTLPVNRQSLERQVDSCKEKKTHDLEDSTDTPEIVKNIDSFTILM